MPEKDTQATSAATTDRWFTPFGKSPHGILAADAVAASTAAVPLFLLLGYLHRRWGAGASSEQVKGERAMTHSVTITPGQKEAQESNAKEDKGRPPLTPQVRRSAISEGMAVGLPVLTAGMAYLAGVKLADKKRKIIDGKATTRRLDQAQEEYNRILRDRLYPQPEAPEAEEKETEAHAPLSLLQMPAPTDVEGAVIAEYPKVASAKDGARALDRNLGQIPGAGVAMTAGAGVFLLAYTMTKKWADANDPKRRRAKEIKDAVESRSVHRWTPVLVIDDPEIKKNLAQEHLARVAQ